MSKICGECEDYYCCKSDSKLRGKYLPKNIKACRDFNPSRDYQAKRITELEKAIQDICDAIHNEGEVNKWKIANWLEQALEGG